MTSKHGTGDAASSMSPVPICISVRTSSRACLLGRDQPRSRYKEELHDGLYGLSSIRLQVAPQVNIEIARPSHPAQATEPGFFALCRALAGGGICAYRAGEYPKAGPLGCRTGRGSSSEFGSWLTSWGSGRGRPWWPETKVPENEWFSLLDQGERVEGHSTTYLPRRFPPELVHANKACRRSLRG